MKNVSKILFILLSIILVNCNGQKQRVSSKSTVIKDKLIYHEGKIYSGDVYDVYSNEQLRLEFSVKDGKRHGLYEEFDKGGYLFESTTYNDGIMDGPFETYWNRKLSYKGSYKDGKKDGLWEEYLEGSLNEITTFKDGVLIKKTLIENYKSGKLMFKVDLINDKWEGIRENYYENGVLIMKTQYINDKVVDGTYNYFKQNGELLSKVTFKNGNIFEGTVNKYNREGEIIGTESYKNGKKISN